MTIRQGFNRLGVSVAIAFMGLAVVCLLSAGANYVQYRSEIAYELQLRVVAQSKSPANVAAIQSQITNSPDWARFTTGRYRSVEQALDLAGLCVVAAIVSFIFWSAIGWIFVRLGAEDEEATE
ncbi:MAG: hypothetical protein AAGB04_20020 [Pseudomonadota bacterium]